MKTTILGIAMSLAMIGAALGATITNKDDHTQKLVVTEDGKQFEMYVDAGATVSFCANGCFVTMPSGDRETFAGDETIAIINGSAVIE